MASTYSHDVRTNVLITVTGIFLCLRKGLLLPSNFNDVPLYLGPSLKFIMYLGSIPLLVEASGCQQNDAFVHRLEPATSGLWTLSKIGTPL